VNYCLPTHSNGEWPKMGNTNVHSAGIYTDNYGVGRMVVWGQIGNTQCCGSAEVYGVSEMSSNFLEWLFKATRAGVILFHYYSWNRSEILPAVDDLNRILDGMARVEAKPLVGNKWMLILHTEDADSLSDWFYYD